MATDYPIIIVGAGPGGLMAAWHLAQAGQSVLVLDKAAFPRQKACGDILTSNVIRALHACDPLWLEDLLEQSWAMPLASTSFGSAKQSGFVMPFNSPSNQKMGLPSCISAKRHDFDAWFLQKVAAHPLVEIWQDCAVKSAERKGEKFLLETGRGQLASRYLLLATGANSSLSKSLVAGQEALSKHSAIGLRIYFEGMQPHSQVGLSEYYLFDKKFMPGGLYITPFADGSANVNAVMRMDVHQRSKPRLSDLMEDYIRQHPSLAPRFANARPVGSPLGSTLYLGTKRRPLSSGNCLLIGDAAGLTDATNANGIGHAMISGEIAAQHVQAAITTDSMVMGYDAAVYKRLKNALKAGMYMKAVFSNPLTTRIGTGLLNASLHRINSRAVEEFVYSANTTLTLINPAFYWRLFAKGQ